MGGSQEGHFLYSYVRADTEVADEPAQRATRHAAIIRGVLFLGTGHDRNRFGDFGSCPTPRLLDISGRSIMSLSPGPNDVSHLSPGIYFVHEEPSAAGRGSPIVRKVMVLR